MSKFGGVALGLALMIAAGGLLFMPASDSNLNPVDRLGLMERQNTALKAKDAYQPCQALALDFQYALQALAAFEKELSQRYTNGEKVLNSELEWVDPPTAGLGIPVDPPPAETSP